MKKASKKHIKIRRIERGESHFNRAQTYKILSVGFFFVLGWFILVPPSPTNISNEQMVFQFHGAASDWGIANTQTHGAADRRDYLFDGATGTQQIFTGTTNVQTQDVTSQPNLTSQPTTSGKATITNINTQGKYAKVIVGDLQIPNYYVATETIIFSRDLAQYYLEHFLEGDYSKLFVTVDGYTPKNCASPDGEMIAHGDFIIAYKQRTDVTTICNVEKRYCNDGILLGSYLQTSCEEKTAYQYDKIIPTSENEFVPGEYVQPTAPANQYANFDSQGKIDGQLDPTTRWDAQPADAQVVNNAGIAQTVTQYRDCRTPWNEKVLNGQFVRAYKTNQGYFNRPCEVEIRMCIDGKLKGTFKYKACVYTGASYEMAHGSN